jgi:sugar phosphate isomerase/epimerase
MNIIAASTLPYLNSTLGEALKIIEGQGFEGVEIYYEGRHHLPQKEILDELSIYDFQLYLHAPFSDLNLASFNQTVLDESKRQIKRSLEVASTIGIDLVTIHFGRYSPLGLSYPEKAVKRNRESVQDITEHAESLGLDIAFENAPNGFGAMYGPLENIEKLIQETSIKITLDMGHAHTWNIKLENFIFRLNSQISHIHIHDNTGETDMHLGMGEGGIDYKSAFEALREINYKNALCLEMLYEKDLKSSRKMIKSLIGV